MKKMLRWISIQLLCFSFLFAFCINESFSQQLWGMNSDGGSKKTGGNIFSINGDGTGFTERFAFLNDAGDAESSRLLNYGDGFLYGVGNNILFRHLYDGSLYQVMYVFQDATGNNPRTRLIKGLDGYLYGTTMLGGNHGDGVIYKVQTNGTGYQVLHHFNGTNGEFPLGNLMQFNNGLLCGTTNQGGSNDKGVVYRIDPDGTGFQVLHSFNGTNGSTPEGGLVALTVNSTTYIYGVTGRGGTNDYGVIYRIEPNGTNFSRQYNFSNSSGKYPKGPLIKVGNVLYGIASMGGNNDGGVVFAYDADADSYQKIHQFTYIPNSSSENSPNGPLLNFNGLLYGTTSSGGSFSRGVLYKMNLDGSGYQVIHHFESDAGYFGNLSTYNNQLYGLTSSGYTPTSFGNGTIYKVNTDGTAFQTIHSFDMPNGFGPSGSLIKAQDGNLYGLTPYGGTGYSNGIAFSIQPDGANFTPLQWVANGASQGNPFGSLVQASNGSFYGMNSNGGTAFAGQLFKLTTGNPVNFVLYNPFCLAPDCSLTPTGSLIQASDGNLYGMTPYTGQNTGQGNIFRISTSGTNYTLLKKFNGTNGANPNGSLIQAPDGYLYGMTENGGLNGFGVIFKMRIDGTGFQTIFEFGQNINALYGAHPKGSLLMGSDGKLYGMTMAGGSGWAGTVFRISPSGGAFSVIYNFNGTNGAFPAGSLVEDVNTGFLFGMTEQGGASNFGTVFKIKKDGTSFQKLLDFDGYNGKYPKGDLLIVVPGTPPPQKNPLAATIERDVTKNKFLIDVSPNPAKNSIFIRFQKQVSGKVTYTLTDLQGRKVLQQTFEQSEAAMTKTVDISRMPSGTYILELTTSLEKVSKKIVKQ
jgi:uncharacterized repeat protein (TIGR03803 family)